MADALPEQSDAPSTPEAQGGSAKADPWALLKALTPARIGLGRSGISQPTSVQLDFQLAHARARDAVFCALDVDNLCNDIEALGLATVTLHSAAENRTIYLQRPDLGRRLDVGSLERLQVAHRQAAGSTRPDLALVIADGLSALAVQRHAAALIGELLRGLRAADQTDDPDGWQLAPVAVVEQGRVAVGDEIGEQLGSRIVVVLIGERPGLSSPDSMGVYLTWEPRPGRVDAQRNCISNVRPEGLGYREAAARLVYLLNESRRRQLSGVDLKDDSPTVIDSSDRTLIQPSFLLGNS
ncbi:MAG: ethanolamine ammonia-lyase subunit EutC [Ideonella sp.]